MKHKSLKSINNKNQANQSKISVYIQYTISPKFSLIEHNHSKKLAFASFE